MEFVREVVQALELNDYIIVGHSFGGWIAATYAMDYQAEMRGMILAAPAGIGDRAFSRHYAYRLPLTWNVPWVDWGLTATSSILEFFGQQERLRSLLMERKALLAQPAARDFVRSRARGAGTGSVESDIHTIQIPTFIIAADRDRLIPLWHCEPMPNSFPKLNSAFFQTHRIACPLTTGERCYLTCKTSLHRYIPRTKPLCNRLYIHQT